MKWWVVGRGKARSVPSCERRNKGEKGSAQIRFFGSRSSKHANLAANSGSIRPLLTPAAVTADIEVLISFHSLESLYRHYGFHASSFPPISLSLPPSLLPPPNSSPSPFLFRLSIHLPPFLSIREERCRPRPSAVDICISIGWLKIYNYAAPAGKNKRGRGKKTFPPLSKLAATSFFSEGEGGYFAAQSFCSRSQHLSFHPLPFLVTDIPYSW